MACRWTEMIVDSIDPQSVANFWAEALGYEVSERDDSYVELRGPRGSGPSLVFVAVPERKSVKNRLHMDVNATDRDRDDEVERLLGLGARRTDVGQGDDVSWVVLADPEGNEFCVLRSRVEPLE